jgi:hypothetical protein
VRTGAAVGTRFDILGEGDLDTEQLAAGALQCPANRLQTDPSAAAPPRQGTAAFVRFEP